MAIIVGIHGNREFELDYRPKPLISILNTQVAEIPSLYDHQLSERMKASESASSNSRITTLTRKSKGIFMKIALIIENSQAAKSDMVHTALSNVASSFGHEWHHYGMYGEDDPNNMTYVMNGLLTGILLNSGAADFVVTGCGTGMGSMLACNSMPGVFCGLVIDPTDAFLFSQINDGNAISMPYAKGFGWAAELNLEDCYRKLFEQEGGLGYPKERVGDNGKEPRYSCRTQR